MVSTMGEMPRTQDFTYTSGAAGIGFGPRSDLNKFATAWTPAPNNYDVAKFASENSAPKMK